MDRNESEMLWDQAGLNETANMSVMDESVMIENSPERPALVNHASFDKDLLELPTFNK